MRAAPVLPRTAARVHRAAQARRSVAVPTDRAAPAPPNPRMLRRRVVARRRPPSGPFRPPAPHRLRLRARRSRLPQSAPSLRPRRLSARPARLPRSANGIAIVQPASASARGSSRLRPKRLRAPRLPPLRLRRLSRTHLRPRPSSGLPQAPHARPMRSAPPVRVTPSDRTVSAPVTSAPARMRLPRPLPRRRLHRLLQQLLLQRLRLRPLRQRRRQRGPSRLRPLLRPRPPQREPSRRHQPRLLRARLRLSRQRLPRPSRLTLPACASRTCAASGGSVGRAGG